METRQEALRRRAGEFANLGRGYLATAGKTPDVPGQLVALRSAADAYNAADDILRQLDGDTRKRP